MNIVAAGEPEAPARDLSATDSRVGAGEAADRSNSGSPKSN
jgi:hypothetical protein